MKNGLLAILVVSVAMAAPSWSEAKRLGGGKSQGMQRSAPAPVAPQTPPKQATPQPASPQQAAPQQPAAQPAAAAPAAAAAAPAKRSWLGPVAGLAAGLGLAALMSHLGLGEAFANMLMLALLAVAVVLLVAFLMRRFGGARREPLVAAGAGGASPSWQQEPPAPLTRESSAVQAAREQPAAFVPASSDVSVTGRPLAPLSAGVPEEAPSSAAAPAGVSASPAPALPSGFDLPAFERVAKMIFIRLQAANDAGDLEDLRRFTTPEMFAALRVDLQERGQGTQSTDVEQVDANVVDYAEEAGRQIVSVRFHGRIREDAAAPATNFDEVWHLVKPLGDGGSWAIAGIQQPQ